MTSSSIGIRPPGHRLPDSLRLGPIVLEVADLSRSIEFYGEVLGFRVIDEGERSAELGVDETILVHLTEESRATPVPRDGRIGLFHVAYLLPTRADLGRFIRHATELGIRLGMSDHLVSEAVYLSDPDGLGVEVCADRPSESWAVRGREIAMDTRPLDVSSVMEIAGFSHWDGAPSGTRIGHVHLSVGDLTSAERFYHEVLGFDKIVWSYPGALFLSAGGYHHHLGLNTWARGAAAAGDGDARLTEWSVLLPDEAEIQKIARTLRDRGISVDEGNGDMTVTDPHGIRVRFRRG
jgi:catechol 2,3-dioxygenase